MIRRSFAVAAIAAFALTACTGDRTAASAPAAAPAATAVTPGRYIEEGRKFYAEILHEHKGRKAIYLFSDEKSLAEFESSGEVPPPVKTMIGAGPVLDGRKLSVTIAMANPKNLTGGADEAKVRDNRIMKTFKSRYGIDLAAK